MTQLLRQHAMSQRHKMPAHLRAGNGQPPQDGTLLAIPGAFTRTSLTLEPGLSFEAWEHVGHTLRSIGGGVLWWIGDWYLYGERVYGENAAQAVGDDTGYSAKTVLQAAWVAGRFECSRRLENLPWNTHMALAGVENGEERCRLLKQAVEGRWTVKQAREVVRDYKQTPGAHEAKHCASLPSSVRMGEYLLTLLRDVGEIIIEHRDKSGRGIVLHCADLTGEAWGLLTEAHDRGVNEGR